MIGENRVALVSGAGSGIGQRIALELGKAGARVAAFDLNFEAAKATEAKIREAGGQGFAVSGDVSKRDDCFAAVSSVLSNWGRLDIQVNCAGILIDNVIKNITEETWDKIHAINLKGPLFCMQAALAPMKEQQYGRILNMASAACLGNAGQAAYSTAKAGVVTLTKVAAQEFSRYGITVNAVAPGMVETPMIANVPPEAFEKIVSGIPMGRIGTPDDIAHMSLALVADEADYVTGQIVFVDGGSTLRKKG